MSTILASGSSDFRYNQSQKDIVDNLITDLKDVRDFFVSGVLKGSATYDAGSIADGDEEIKAVTVTGAALGDFVVASFGVSVADLGVSVQITATDTVTISLLNNTGGAIDLASTTVRVLVLKKSYWYDLLPLTASRVTAT